MFSLLFDPGMFDLAFQRSDVFVNPSFHVGVRLILLEVREFLLLD